MGREALTVRSRGPELMLPDHVGLYLCAPGRPCLDGPAWTGVCSGQHSKNPLTIDGEGAA